MNIIVRSQRSILFFQRNMNMALHFLKFIQVFSDFGKKAFYLLESPPPLSTIKDIEDYFHVFDRS